LPISVNVAVPDMPELFCGLIVSVNVSDWAAAVEGKATRSKRRAASVMPLSM
jgi:hypothetical protein